MVSRAALRCSRYESAFGPLGVCLYLAGFGLPLQWDIPLAGLGLLSALAIVCRVQNSHRAASRLAIVVLGFLLTMALSTLVSKDIGRSLQLSTPLLPAVLLFILIAEHCKSLRDIRYVYLTLSLVGLGLASTVLGVAWMHGTVEREVIVAAVGSPILLVPNDSAFLAVVAPLSLAILCRQPRSVGGILAALSILSGVLVVYIMQSLVGILTTMVSIACAVTLLRPSASHLGLVSSGAILMLGFLLLDGLCGFPLVVKCIAHWQGNGRIPLWLASWCMVLDAPWLGHGPHTFVLLYRSYLHSLSLPTWLPADSRIVPWVHNLYLEVLAEQGIVGFTALVILLACGLSVAWKIQRTASAEARLLGVGALASLLSLCGAAVVELTLLRQWVAVVLCVLLGVIAHLSSCQTPTWREDKC